MWRGPGVNELGLRVDMHHSGSGSVGRLLKSLGSCFVSPRTRRLFKKALWDLFEVSASSFSRLSVRSSFLSSASHSC